MGSEMCIRDRAQIDGVALGLRFFGFDLQVCSSRVSECKPQAYDCLLYTSDAADERSSVDLGGRRIIKKKKAKVPLPARYVPTKTVIKLASQTRSQ